jgi:hypothetical protein
MEPAGTVSMEEQYRLEDCATDFVVGDEDADVEKALKEAFNEDAPKKVSDLNHFKGGIRKKMVGGKKTKKYIQDDHRCHVMKETGLKQYPAACKRCDESAIGPAAADYICSNLMTVVHTHQSDPLGISKGFAVAIDHAFDKHDGCSKDWCKSLSEDEKIRAQAFKRLPRGKPLKGTVLRRMLLEMANKYVSPEICKRLAHGWHSQNCESLHQMIYSKNAKDRSHVSGHVFGGRALRLIAVKNLGHAGAIG